jgi:hypothetical protein
VKEYSVFGQRVKVGLIEVEFDQDLYVLLALRTFFAVHTYSVARACERKCPDLTGVNVIAATTCTDDLDSLCSSAPVWSLVVC